MSEKQGSMGDELDSSIDTGTGLAGEAVKQGINHLPSRRPAGSRPGAGDSVHSGNPSGVATPSTDGTPETESPATPAGETSSAGEPHKNSLDSGEPVNRSDTQGADAQQKVSGTPSGNQARISSGRHSSNGQTSENQPETPPISEHGRPQDNGRPSNQTQGNQQRNHLRAGEDGVSDAPNLGDETPFLNNGAPFGSGGAREGSDAPAAGSPEAVANRLPEAQGAAAGSGGSAAVSGIGAEAPTTIAGGAGAESGAGMAAGAAGSGGGVAAGSAAGSAAGAGAGAAAGGSAAAGGAAAAGGTAGGAAGGAAAGATAGTLAGPVGTVAGAVAGALIVPAIKLLTKLIIMTAVLTMMFSMLPSFLFDNPEAVNDRVALEDTYNHFYESISDAYEKDILAAREDAAVESLGHLMALKIDPRAVLDERVKLSEEDVLEIEDGIAEAYDALEYVHWRGDVETLRTLAEYKEAISGNINMVLSMIEQGKKNWFVQVFSYILNTLTNGWFANFSHSLSSWWDGFWNDFIVAYLYQAEATVVITESDTWPDGEEEYEYLDDAGEPDKPEDEDSDEVKLHCYITITFTYDMQDKGYAFYADKKGLNQSQIDRAAEMATYLSDLFGNENEDYVPVYTIPGYYDDAKSGGSASSNLANSMTELEDDVGGLVYDPNGPHAFPLQGQSNYPISSHYGPRNFPPDPWHTGIDFSIGGGHPVCSVADGVVLYIAQHKGGFGNHIAVYHGSDVMTLYCHLNAAKPFGQYRAGDKVSAGDVIGYVGKTGLSTGNHLHFQLHVGPDLNVRNPVGFFEMFDYAKP